MARDAVDAAARGLGADVRSSRTHELPLIGASGGAAAMLEPRSGIGRQQLDLLLARHGACADEVAAQAVADPRLASPVVRAERDLRAGAAPAVAPHGAPDPHDVLAPRVGSPVAV